VFRGRHPHCREAERLHSRAVRSRQSDTGDASLEDTYYNVRNLKEIYEKKNVTVCEMKRGNHSLEVHDIEEDIERLKDILIKERNFIRKFLA